MGFSQIAQKQLIAKKYLYILKLSKNTIFQRKAVTDTLQTLEITKCYWPSSKTSLRRLVQKIFISALLHY